MSFPIANLEKFLIPLEEIKSATEEFRYKNEIADGEYSKLYRGKLSESWENRTAAFKRFIKDRCDGKKEFLNELKFISNLNHENIVSFLGYCDEGEEMIIVYDYPVDGSLLTYLDWRALTWQQRLEICMDAARGLNYLHSGLGQHETVIHGSFMENNILLDVNLKAKICGFEISEFVPGNQPCQQVYKPYTNKDMNMRRHKDPIYLETGFLKPESDVYSFGVLLFTILTSTQAFEASILVGDDSMDNCGMKSVPVTPNATSSVDDMGSMHVNKSGDHVSPLISFANLVKGDSSRKAVNFRPLFTPAGNGVNVYDSKESVSVVNERLNKTLYGMEAMLENGPWFIRNVPLILRKCAIATKLGTPLMLDSYTAAMCTDSWERASYARAMVELRADVELSDTIVVALPKFSRRGRGNQIPSTNATPVVARINDLERQMVDGKLVLVDKHEKPLEMEGNISFGAKRHENGRMRDVKYTKSHSRRKPRRSWSVETTQ
nr:protein kinase, ATP binding site-containing protein [Tanacetum cinerariifolium]